MDAISKIYPPGGKDKKRKHTLKGVSFNLYEGGVLGLLGENGAGKTTLCGILASLHPPTKGCIYWRGRSIKKQLMAYRAIMGFCPQSQQLNDFFSLEESLTFQGRAYGFSREQTQKSVTKWMDKLGLQPYAKAFPKQLSGGYRQHFLIAKALIHHPKIVLLDEPTVGLDPQACRQLWDCVSLLKEEGVSVILTTHYLDEAEKLSDRICVLDHGLVKGIGTQQELLEKYGQESLEALFLEMIN